MLQLGNGEEEDDQADASFAIFFRILLPKSVHYESNVISIRPPGPAGAGKSTFCSSVITHAQTLKRTIHYVNLDPAATSFDYEPAVDIRDLIDLQDVMEELEFGPNGGLVYCFE